ncbi:response regulator [Ekhidna sp.]|uniref:response regulator n=1 Tax=Ekhidna sp. TaxID=2608089 RepID=UPI003B506692
MKRIVLIDDDETTNYLNKLIIERAALVDEVVSFDSAQDALNFFSNNQDEEDESLVLLDINMPIMNGWQFLDRYQMLQKQNGNKFVILTSSINPADKEMAEEKNSIIEYMAKPLSIEMINELVSNYLN